MEAPQLNIDEVEVIVPGIDFTPARTQMFQTPVAFSLRYKGLLWTVHHPADDVEHVAIINEGTSWGEMCRMDRYPSPFKMIHITSASSISRAFVPTELLPYIEALLKLHA